MTEVERASASPEGSRSGVRVPRELVLASAGTGKTFRLSSRIVALLNAGAAPGEILASTFTRKAAGEILERVLLRLARAQGSEEAREELASHAALDGAPALDRERAGAVLARLVDDLHRTNVSTLDSFLHRIAGAFAFELGLPAAWTVADPAEEEALVASAVDALLDRADEEELVELLRLYRSGEVARGVHGEVVDIVSGLQEIYRGLDPSVPDPWGLPEAEAGPPTDAEIDELARRISEVEAPLTNAGTPRKAWLNALVAHADALRGRDWDALFRKGLFAKLVADEAAFGGAPIPDDVRELFGRARGLARRDLERVYRDRARALGRLAAHFEAAFLEVQERRGMYRFQDIPHLLLAAGATERGAELYYRLDGRIRHLLLDEFQDTSVVQWRALVPLAGEILQDAEGERAVVVVADPKQSIYAWRGGEPRLLDVVRSHSGLPVDTLRKSYRSARPVLDAVNDIFAELAESEALDDVQRDVAGDWLRAFPVHEPAFDELPGYVRVVEAPPESHGRSVRESVLRAAVDEVVAIRSQAPAASVGVLCRTRKVVTRVIHYLREEGVEVSDEGGSPVVDAWPVHLVLAALRLADHPGDRLARYVVGRSPLGPSLGLGPDGADREAAGASARARETLLARGYGPVIDEWAELLRDHSSPRDRRRLDQLVELAFAQDARDLPLRPGAFIAAAERVSLEAPDEAAVRVMTVHAAKGLEFDAVVLPDLESAFGSGRGDHGPLPERSEPGGPIVRVHPYVTRSLLHLFPEVEAVDRERRASRFRDELGAFYVALTRARHATHLVVERGREEKNTPARLVREGLGIAGDDPDSEAVAVVGERGEPEWAVGAGKDRAPPPRVPTESGDAHRRLRLAASTGTRSLARVTPSELEGRDGRRVADLLRRPDPRALERGTVVHAWLEAIEWLDDGLPDRARLLEIARDRGPRLPDPESLVADFLVWLEAPPIRGLLTRAGYPPGTRVDRELAFLARDGDRLIEGVADRVIRIPGEDGDRMVVVDWKTDHVEVGPELDERSAYYRPQIGAYVRAVAFSEGIPLERAGGTLAFLTPGVVREI